MLEILYPALIGGMLLTLVAGPLGALVIWRRQAYVGDTLAHGALLGVALSLFAELPMSLSVILSGLLLVLLLRLQRGRGLGEDTRLGIIAHSSLALGLVATALSGSSQLDLSAYLVGDILALTAADLPRIALISATLGITLLLAWKPLVRCATSEELARVEGSPVERIALLQMAMIALLVAGALQLIGALLITSLLIIPAATAGSFSRSPEQVARWAALLGTLCVPAGLALSLQADLPAGPAIVVCCSTLFLISQCYAARARG